MYVIIVVNESMSSHFSESKEQSKPNEHSFIKDFLLHPKTTMTAAIGIELNFRK